MAQLWRVFGGMVPLFLIIVLVAMITTYLVSRKRNFDTKKRIVNILFILSLIAILLVTVFPQTYGAEMPRIVNYVPFIGMYNILFHSVDIIVPISNLGFNILLFVPFGFFLSFIKSSKKKSVFKIILMGLFLSLCIEVIQFVVPMGRSADVDDLILNTVGTYLGHIIWILFYKFFDMFTLEETELKRLN